MATTLAQLVNMSRLFLDDSTSTVVSDADLYVFINNAERMLWQHLSDTDESFGLREATTTLVQAQTDYTYPEDILGRNIRSLHAYTTGTDPWHKVKKATYDGVIMEGTDQDTYPKKYCCLDGFIKVAPPPDDSGYTLRIAYTRQPTYMSSAESSMDSDDEFAEIISLDAAIKVLQIKGGDTRDLKERRAALIMDAKGLAIPDDVIESRPTWKYQTGLSTRTEE